MSTIEQAGLYQEQTGRVTSQDEIDRCYAWFRQNYGQAGAKKVNA